MTLPQLIADLIDAPPPPNVSVSPDRRRLLVLQPRGLPPLEELAQPELRLAGLRINPRNHAPSRGAHYGALRIMELDDGRETPVTGLPPAPRIAHVAWSPDSCRVAFLLVGDDACELWTFDVADGRAAPLAGVQPTALANAPFRWCPDSRSLVCLAVPPDLGPPPAEPPVAEPVVQESRGATAPARTFQDLLKNAHDEALLEHYLAAQAVRVSVDGQWHTLGEPGLVVRADPSPDGRYLLVTMLARPFSYLVPASRFPRRIDVWDAEGTPLATVADLPLAEEVPVHFDAVRCGPRSVHWRADAGASLAWVEAQDGGDPRVEADVRDQLYQWAAPFDAEPDAVVPLAWRFRGAAWGDGSLALVSEHWWKTRSLRLWRVRPNDWKAEPQLLWERSTEDRYNDPGQPLMQRSPAGRRVLLRSADGAAIYLAGGGASPEGNRPFVDRFELETHDTTRLWRSEAPWYESPVTFVDAAQEKLMLRRESVDVPPNFFLRDLASGADEPLTHFPHPTPQLEGVSKDLLRYQRADGVTCTATLYLPPGYTTDDAPLPALLWAYPMEFKSAQAASQLTDSPHRFIRFNPYSPLMWATQGYAVLDGPTMPIVGEGDAEPNDTYVQQLVASAEAAVEEIVRRGVADGGRVAVGGYSYGAFMTANLLAHTDAFRAGVACSGAFNRTLTPFGFQSEERTLWEAPETYFRVSPYMHADTIKTPLLLIHGAEDENAGTYPMQSERMFQALKGHGGTVRLVLLPHEGHAYRARESLHRMAEEIYDWLQEHCAAE